MDNNSSAMDPNDLLMEAPYAEGSENVSILSDDFFTVKVSSNEDKDPASSMAVAVDLQRRWNGHRGPTGHFPGTRVQVLCQDGWKPGTVHKEIMDNKLTGHDEGDVITTTTWVVWLAKGGWWRSDMAEHIRRA